jgi:hypothetical protein
MGPAFLVSVSHQQMLLQLQHEHPATQEGQEIRSSTRVLTGCHVFL